MHKPFQAAKFLSFSVSLLVHLALLFSSYSGEGQRNAHSGVTSSASIQITEIVLGSENNQEAIQWIVDIGAKSDMHSDVLAQTIAAPALARPTVDDARAPLFPSKPYYFSISELSVKPAVVIDLPEDLRLTIEGLPQQIAVLRIQISEYGDIDRVIVEDTLLAESVQNKVSDAFSKTRFLPGERNGVAVKSEMRIEVFLENADAEINIGERSFIEDSPQ